jgi:hypothetical protein
MLLRCFTIRQQVHPSSAFPPFCTMQTVMVSVMESLHHSSIDTLSLFASSPQAMIMLLIYILVRFVGESETSSNDPCLWFLESLCHSACLKMLVPFWFCCFPTLRHHSLAIGVFASSTVGEFCQDAPADDNTACLASQWVVAILYIGGGAGGTVTRRMVS